jgi:hypothetical protein
MISVVAGVPENVRLVASKLSQIPPGFVSGTST